MKTTKTCERCGNTFTQNSRNVGRFCSRTCLWAHKREHVEEFAYRKGKPSWNKGLVGFNAGEKHWNWDGGVRQHSEGYTETYAPNHPEARHGGYVYTHRLVAEKMLGRPLLKTEVVHHKNEKRADNRRRNLKVFASEAEHQSYHAKKQWAKKK